MSMLWRAYQRALAARPITTQVLSAGVFAGVCAHTLPGLLTTTGDVLAQIAVERRALRDYDYKRSLRFAAIGWCFIVRALACSRECVCARRARRCLCGIVCWRRARPARPGCVRSKWSLSIRRSSHRCFLRRCYACCAQWKDARRAKRSTRGDVTFCRSLRLV